MHRYQPAILKGSSHTDARGVVTFNNGFDASLVKRIYTVENRSTDLVRGWQGHRVEQRWFACIKGCFEILVITIDDFDHPSADLPIAVFQLQDHDLTYLHVPAGHVTAIRSMQPGSKLLVLADYASGEIADEYRLPIDYFCGTK